MPVSAQGLYTVSAPTGAAIIGDGKLSLALASMLASSGQPVRLWAPDRNVPAECEVRERNARVGQMRCKTEFALLSDDLGAVLKDVSVIFLSVPAIEYGASLAGLSPYLTNGQTIVLANAPLGAALQFSRQLGVVKRGLQVNILEMGALYDQVKIEGNVALLVGPRKRVSVCGLSRNETRRALSAVSGLGDRLVPASNVLERGFTEVERMVRTTLRLLRLVGAKSTDPRSTSAAITPAMVSIVSAIGGELQSVAREFKVPFPSLGQMLINFAGASGRSLGEILGSVSGVLLQDTENGASVQEKLRREVAETFVLVEEFARLTRLPVPVIDSVIQLATVITECDLRKEGRGLSDLGLVGSDVAEIVEVVNA